VDQPQRSLDPLQLRHMQIQAHPVDRLQLEDNVIGQDVASTAG